MGEHDIQSYMTELRRGSLTLAALGCLKQPYYGYALLQVMQQKGIEVEANTLYPLLRRLEEQGLLSSDWDTSESRPRKYYTISAQGEEIYKQLIEEWRKMQQSVDAIIEEEKQ